MVNKFPIMYKSLTLWLDLKSKSISVETIAVTSVALLFAFTSIYANFVYMQFERSEILITSLLFIILFSGLVVIFNPWVIEGKYKFNGFNTFFSIIIFIALILWLHSPDEWVLDYFRTFPTIEAELGLGWHIDSTFHVAIINSINNFGYPSTGQHDVPILYYHVLSHYLEALIIGLSGVNAWDSYGMVFYFKRATVLAAIVFFAAAVCRNKRAYIFILTVFVLIPFVAASWQLVGSHGLWFPSLLLILSSPIVYGLLSQEKRLELRDYIFLFVLLILISIGKASSGFTCALVVGLILLFKSWRDYRIYVFGLLLLVFFALYGWKFSHGSGGLASLDIPQFFKFLLLKTDEFNNQLYQVYLLIVIAGILALVFRLRSAKYLVFSGIISILMLGLYFNISRNQLSTSDIYYFIYGLSNVLILLVYQEIVDKFSSDRITGTIVVNSGAQSYNVNLKIVLILCIFFIAGKLNMTYINLYTINIDLLKSSILSINFQPFEKINSKSEGPRVSVLSQLGAQGLKNFDNYPTKYRQFRDELSEFMQGKGLTPKNTLLFLPKEIYAQEPNFLGRVHWARGLFLYAFTGVPLINGVSTIYGAYGFPVYKNTSSTWLNRSELGEAEACRFKKSIVVVEDFNGGKFSLIKCKQ